MLWTVARQVPLSMHFPGKNTGMGCHAFLQGVFPTQWSNSLFLLSPARAVRFFTTSAMGSPSTGYQFSSVHFSRSVVSNSLWPHQSQHVRPPCPSPSPEVHSDSRPLSWWCHPAISSSVFPFSSCPQSLPIWWLLLLLRHWLLLWHNKKWGLGFEHKQPCPRFWAPLLYLSGPPAFFDQCYGPL